MEKKHLYRSPLVLSDVLANVSHNAPLRCASRLQAAKSVTLCASFPVFSHLRWLAPIGTHNGAALLVKAVLPRLPIEPKVAVNGLHLSFDHVQSPSHHDAPLPCGHAAHVLARWFPQFTFVGVVEPRKLEPEDELKAKDDCIILLEGVVYMDCIVILEVIIVPRLLILLVLVLPLLLLLDDDSVVSPVQVTALHTD